MKTRHILFLAASFAVNWQYAGAAVTVNSATGTLTNGTTAWIIGSGFGDMPTYPFHDTLDVATFHSTYTDTAELSHNTNNTRYSGDVNHAYINFQSSGTHFYGYFTYRNSPQYKNWRIVYWARVHSFDWGTSRYDGTDKFLSNIKMFRMWNPGSTDEDFAIATEGWGNQIISAIENVSGMTNSGFFSGYQTSFTQDKWHRLDFEYSSSDFDTTNGTVTFRFDGNLMTQRTGIKNHDTDNVLERPFIIGFFNSWGAGENGGGGADPTDNAPNELWIDDVHVQPNGLQSVQLSTCTTEDTGCVPEDQDITDWQTGTIRFVVRPRSLSGTVYVRVVDRTGARNATAVQMADAAVPTTALAPRSFGVTSSSSAFQWASVPASNFLAVMDNDSNFASPLSSGILSVNTTMYSSLNPGNTYYFKVKISTEDDASYATHSTQTYRTNMSPVGVANSSTSVTFSWNTSMGVQVVMDDDPAFGSPSSSGTLTGNTTTYNRLSPTTRYEFEVKPSSDGVGSYTTANATTNDDEAGGAPPPKPLPPPHVKGNFAIKGSGWRFGRP